MIELVVGPGSLLRNRTVAEVEREHQVQAIAHAPAGAEWRVLLDVRGDARLAAGDRIAVCGRPRDLARMLAQAEEETLPHVRWASWLRRMGRVAWRTLGEVDVSVKVCTSVLVVVVAVSTLVYVFGIGLSAPDALICATSPLLKPSTFDRISSVCSPSSGERFTSEIESDILIGLPTVRYLPRTG